MRHKKINKLLSTLQNNLTEVKSFVFLKPRLTNNTIRSAEKQLSHRNCRLWFWWYAV